MRRAGGLIAGLAAFLCIGLPTAADQVAEGAYLIRAAGCVSCHTDHKNDGKMLAGGRALETPFGTFYSPNITPDKQTGIGGWSGADFVVALRDGTPPGGSHYFPAFPFTTYTNMTEPDMLAIKAYLDSLAPVERPNRDHEISWPFSWRFLQTFWKLLFFDTGPMQPDPDRSDIWNRGAYLVEALAHCGECHTPRNALGGLDRDQWMAGTPDGPNGELVPNITPDMETGIGDWSEGDIAGLLKSGLKPNFDDVQGSMQEAIEDGLKHLTDDDLRAIAVYIKALPPIENKVERQR